MSRPRVGLPARRVSVSSSALNSPDPTAPLTRPAGPGRTLRCLLPWILLFSLLGVNCAESSSTQLVVLMDTDYLLPTEVDRVRARIAKMVETDGGLDEVQTWERMFSVSNQEPAPPGAHALPATFVVLPEDADVDGEIVVELEALAAGTDQTLGARRVRTKFVRGDARLLRMLIHRACREIACGDGESCGCPNATSCATPSCVDEWVSPDALEPIVDPSQLPPNSQFPIEGDPDAGVSDDGGFPPTDGGGGTGGVGGINCEPPLEVCNTECVNTATDPRFCGDCAVGCPIGFVCKSGSCLDPGDCRTNDAGCSGFTYCDVETGDCLRGCTIDDQCVRDHEVCDVQTHACVCEPDFKRCAFECVDTQADPRFCGDCSTSCPLGEVCEMGECLDPGDCRTSEVGCTGFTYCDAATGDCLRGCERDQQCTGENRVCDTVMHDCVCDLAFHACGGTCVSDLDVNSCGDSCTPCPRPPGSTATCEEGICGFVCDGGLAQCGSECVDTQTDPRFCGACTTSCPPGDECKAGQCFDPGDCRTNGIGCAGFTYCDNTTGNCLPGCDMDAQCSSQNEICDLSMHACVCAEGFHRCVGVCVSDQDTASCGTLCAPCPSPPSSTATCKAGVCDFVCSDGFEKCGTACCSTGCPAGQVLFEGACATSHVRTVDDRGENGQYSSIALDAAGRPRIAYHARSGRSLRYSALLAEGLWSYEIVDNSGDVGGYASVAMDPVGKPWIAYYVAHDKVPRVATREAGGAWITTSIGPADDVGEYTSLAFDPAGTPHVAYYDEGNKDLLFATRLPTGVWLAQIVDSEGNVGKHASLAFDASGVAHIAYYDEGNKDLLLATQEDGEWSVEIIDGQLNVGEYASLVFDAAGNAHVSYYDKTNEDLKLATRRTDASWTAETVDSVGEVGRYTSLAFDTSGTAHISYEDESNHDLRHAVREHGGAWVLETVDGTEDVGEFTSIAVDTEGHAHISYYDWDNKNLKYAIVAAPE